MEKVIIKRKAYIEGDLANFLKKEGVLQEFVEESRRLNEWEGKYDMVIDSISGGLFWIKSNKGHEFWSKLEDKYLANR